jgi:hypothetical protein
MPPFFILYSDVAQFEEKLGNDDVTRRQHRSLLRKLHVHRGISDSITSSKEVVVDKNIGDKHEAE